MAPMKNFVTGIVISVAIGVGVTLVRTKRGERLKASLQVVLAILAVSLACGLAVLLGVPVKGITE
jgi:hypothetical protein